MEGDFLYLFIICFIESQTSSKYLQKEIFREMEWDVAISGRLQGLTGGLGGREGRTNKLNGWHCTHPVTATQTLELPCSLQPVQGI